MTWREQLQPGSFRGVAFLVDAHDASSGRRLAIHEYPFRDEVYAEDLGRSGRTFGVEAYVVGDDYMAARDALIDALEQPGPGTLRHPYLGLRTVAVQSYRLSETTREGGLARLSIQFVETGEARYPAASAATQARAAAAADAATAAAQNDFARIFDVASLPQAYLTEIEAELDRTLSALTAKVGDITGPIAAEIRAPGNMAAALLDAVRQLEAVATEPLRAFGLYETLFEAGSTSPIVPQTTANRRVQAVNVGALHRLTRQAAVIEAARQAAAADYAARRDAQDVSDRLMAGIDAQLEAVDPVSGAPIDDAVYWALVALRAAASADLRTRGARLPDVMAYTPPATLPALVIAHQLYGDASRDADLVARNRIRHPGFVAGGQALEVLSV